jgi:hypothetical protein
MRSRKPSGPRTTLWEVVGSFPDISDNEAVVDENIGCFGDDVWCDRNPFGFSGSQRYQASWEEFCRTVKHKTRFFVGNDAIVSKRHGSENELTPVSQALSEIAAIIRDARLERVLPMENSLFRIRPHAPSIVCSALGDLGPPPEDCAPNNRMSAAGMSVFYRTALRRATPPAEDGHGAEEELGIDAGNLQASGLYSPVEFR